MDNTWEHTTCYKNCKIKLQLTIERSPITKPMQLNRSISPGGTPHYKPYIGMCRPKGYPFSDQTAQKPYRLCPFWSGIGYGFRGKYESVWTNLSFQFQMCKKEREICEFERILRNLFCVLVWLILYISLYFLYNTNIISIGWFFCWRSNLSNDDIIS